MNHPLIRAVSVSVALGVALSACAGAAADKKPAAFSQADYNKSFTAYLKGEDSYFKDFSEPTLYGASECSPDGAGAAGAQMLCKVGEYDSLEAGKSAYTTEKNRAIKALPNNARGGEQTKVSPTIPVRFAALAGNDGVVIALTEASPNKWLVGYIFRKP